MVMTLPGGTDWLYEITARFHVTSRSTGLSKQRSQNPRAVHGDEWL